MREVLLQDVAAAEQIGIGWNELTLYDVARATGIPLEVVHDHYASKEKLIEAVLERQIREVFAWVKQWVDAPYNVQRKLDIFLTGRNAMLRRYSSLQAFATGSTIGVRPAAHRRLRKLFDRLQENIVYDILDFGVARGHVRSLPAEDLQNIAFIMISALRGVEMQRQGTDTRFGAGNYGNVIMDMLLNGIKTEMPDVPNEEC